MSTCTTYRQLQPEERLTIASLRQQGKGIRVIARTLGRSPCTVSRELARNSDQGYAVHPRAPAAFVLPVDREASIIPFPIQCETRSPAANSATARQGGATKYRVEVEMELHLL